MVSPGIRHALPAAELVHRSGPNHPVRRLFGQLLRFLAYCFPTGWAMDALHQLITFGAGLESAIDEIGVLALFGLAANLAAIRWFRV